MRWLAAAAAAIAIGVIAGGGWRLLRSAAPEVPPHLIPELAAATPAASRPGASDGGGAAGVAPRAANCSDVAPGRISGRRRARVAPKAGEWALACGEWERGDKAALFSEIGGRQVGEALLGDPVEVLRQVGGWSEIRTVGFSRRAVWVRTDLLTLPPAVARSEWEAGRLATVVATPGIETRGPFIPFGARLPFAGSVPETQSVGLLLPDGRCAGVPANAVRLEGELPDLSEALTLARGLRRISYRNGGNSRDAMDGAGLVWLVHRAAGIAVPRASEALFAAGTPVDAESAEPGDVVFFAVYGSEVPQPALLVESGRSVLEASPATGVGLGLLADMQNRRVLAIRRYRARKAGQE